MKNEELSLKTKQMLADALKNAMRTKALTKITVSELVTACDINRKTFYYHFQNIYDLLSWMLEHEAIQIIKEFDLLVDTEETIRFVMDYAEENDYIILSSVETIGYRYVMEFFHTGFSPIFHEVIKQGEKALGIQLDPSFKDFLAEFYINASAGMLIEWTKNKINMDKEDVLENISLIYKVTIPAVMEAKYRN